MPEISWKVRHKSQEFGALMELLMRHARNPGEFASFVSLSKGLTRQPVDLHRLLSRHINEMRPKLWPFEIDILNVGDLGYILTRKLVSVDGGLSEAS